jgi:phytoene dehydrogenase-like protein
MKMKEKAEEDLSHGRGAISSSLVSSALTRRWKATKAKIMNQLHSLDIAIVGGGLAGLAAATYAARAGHSVVVFEKAPQPGGRATTQEVDGFHFNQGPHALYRGGHGIQVLRELGISYSGAQAGYSGSWVLRGQEKFPLPGTPDALAITGLLSEGARREAATLFGTMDEFPVEKWNTMTMRAWLDTHIQHEDLRSYFEGLVRLSTYCNDTAAQSAGAALDQTILGRKGVDYLDGGWQTLVDSLRKVATDAGVCIETRSAVDGIELRGNTASIRLGNGESHPAHAVISTVGPETVARLANGGSVSSLQKAARAAIPIHASCLDIALSRLPDAEHQFAIGLDRPLYYSVHTRSAKLAPGDGAVIQVAKYLPSGAEVHAADVQHELESVMDELQPGWRGALVKKRFLPKMLVTNAVATAAQGGTGGRPGPRVPELANLLLAGDWIGPHGMLADASLASARDAALHLAAQLGTEHSGAISEREALAAG